jgi:deoxyribodipyrimidine photo-lyase
MNARRAIVWLRRDLRLADNPALDWARSNADEILLVYIHAPDEEGAFGPGGASRWWLHHSLEALASDLAGFGQNLLVRAGPTRRVLTELARATQSTLVCWNRLYEPALIARDTEVKRSLLERGIEAVSSNAALLFEPWEINSQSGSPLRVFSPFWRACTRLLDTRAAPSAPPADLPGLPTRPAGQTVASLGLLPATRWDDGLARTFTPGERGAQAALERFLETAITRYAQDRNRPDVAGSSRLSPHLHFGEISPRGILAAIRALDLRGDDARGAESFVRELGWREFAHHLLYHFPATADAPLDSRFEHYPWRSDAGDLHAWERGATGIPIVDAGMRELWQTGWMHNRVRMIVASFLTKNLRIDWRNGARWFWDTLVDADLANNTLGWQWTAGCGADAAPYFRVFNPVLQAERFDPARKYIRKYVPELAALPDKWIHRPWDAPLSELERAGIELGRTYPTPVIDLRASRAAALDGYATVKATARS